MKIALAQLEAEMYGRLQKLESENLEPHRHIQQAAQILNEIMLQLKVLVADYQFPDLQTEIDFFKAIKPKFAAELIYFSALLRLSANRPLAGNKEQRRFYKSEHRKLKWFFEDNRDFYQYCHSGQTHLDEYYFTRKGGNTKELWAKFPDLDDNFTTLGDNLMAQCLANERLLEYWHTKQNRQFKKQQSPPTQLHWTAPKVALIELMYALHAAEVFGSGGAGLNQIAAHFEQVFGVSLGQYHRAFLEIRERKSDPLKFLATLQQKLTARINEAEK